MLGYLRYVYSKRGEIAVAIAYYLFLVMRIIPSLRFCSGVSSSSER